MLVQKGGSNEFFPAPSSGQMHFMTFGTPANYVIVLKVDGSSGSSGTRYVTVVDTSGPTLQTNNVLTVTAPSTIQLPIVSQSPGNGSAFLLDGADGSQHYVMICRSDNGNTLCSLVPFVPTGIISAAATATQLQIKQGTAVLTACSLPAGSCDATPDPLNFPQAVLGAADPTLAVRTLQATIRNSGDDCLTITAIGNSAPYTVINPNPAYGTALTPGQSMTVDVRFAPTAIGTFNVDLPITRSPANGDAAIHCRGTARSATTALSFSGAIDFGPVPL